MVTSGYRNNHRKAPIQKNANPNRTDKSGFSEIESKIFQEKINLVSYQQLKKLSLLGRYCSDPAEPQICNRPASPAFRQCFNTPSVSAHCGL